jgi:molybdopterin-guanine dinucleotide biosynthesis protein A
MSGYSAVVLAGGRATRLGGVNKAQLEIAGASLLERVIGALRPVAEQIVVVGHLAGDNPPSDVQVLPDALEEHGTLVGIYTGLRAVRNEVALVVACDMPFLSAPLLGRIARLSEGYDVAVPVVHGYLEALHAAYRRSCLPVMEEAIRRRQFKIIDFYPDVKVREVHEREMRDLDPDFRSFLNVNTPADLERARTLAQPR